MKSSLRHNGAVVALNRRSFCGTAYRTSTRAFVRTPRKN